MKTTPPPRQPDLICLSHLRWNFVYQRPQHLLSRAAKQRRVFFFEEPLYHDGDTYLQVRRDRTDGVYVAVPHLPHGLSDAAQNHLLAGLLDGLVEDHQIDRYISWFYTPMALKFARRLKPVAAVYDCMDQLSHFKGAPREITLLEQELFTKVDVVFTGGHSLYEAKRGMHRNVHAFPSSVDVPHFRTARAAQPEPSDQAAVPHPRIGYVGVIDERIDLDLIDAVAAARPDWHLVMVGPVVKIDPASLPCRPNIHYLGGKAYEDLPTYLAGWDVAMLPFARNDATRFISPTKTPEYLAAGRRVVSTSIRDVVTPYGDGGLAAIADEPATFLAAVERHLGDGDGHATWLTKADTFLATLSWDRTFGAMWDQVEAAVERGRGRRTSQGSAAVAMGRPAARAATGQGSSASPV